MAWDPNFQSSNHFFIELIILIPVYSTGMVAADKTVTFYWHDYFILIIDTNFTDVVLYCEIGMRQ